MKKALKVLCGMLSAVALFSTAAACGNNDNKKDDKNVIRVFTYSGNEFEGATMDSVFQKIEEKIGVTLEFEGATAEDYYTKLSPMIGSLDIPDIIWADPDNSDGAFQSWANPQSGLAVQSRRLSFDERIEISLS